LQYRTEGSIVVTEADFVIALRHLLRVTIFDWLAARRVEVHRTGQPPSTAATRRGTIRSSTICTEHHLGPYGEAAVDMSARPIIVSADLDLRLVVPGSASLPVRAEVRYEPSDPYAVHMAFHTGTGEVVEWTFARQLLTEGVTRPTGEGDVQVWPSQGMGAETAYSGQQIVCLALSSPSGRALFEIPLGSMIEFLTKTYTAVPTGGESDYVDVDAELALLLWSGPDR
jgi:hypothetical protein